MNNFVSEKFKVHREQTKPFVIKIFKVLEENPEYNLKKKKN